MATSSAVLLAGRLGAFDLSKELLSWRVSSDGAVAGVIALAEMETGYFVRGKGTLDEYVVDDRVREWVFCELVVRRPALVYVLQDEVFSELTDADTRLGARLHLERWRLRSFGARNRDDAYKLMRAVVSNENAGSAALREALLLAVEIGADDLYQRLFQKVLVADNDQLLKACSIHLIRHDRVDDALVMCSHIANRSARNVAIKDVVGTIIVSLVERPVKGGKRINDIFDQLPVNDDWMIHKQKFIAHLLLGVSDCVIRDLITEADDEDVIDWLLTYCRWHLVLGKREHATSLMNQAEREFYRQNGGRMPRMQQFEKVLAIGRLHAAVGHRERATRWLEKATEIADLYATGAPDPAGGCWSPYTRSSVWIPIAEFAAELQDAHRFRNTWEKIEQCIAAGKMELGFYSIGREMRRRLVMLALHAKGRSEGVRLAIQHSDLIWSDVWIGVAAESASASDTIDEVLEYSLAIDSPALRSHFIVLALHAWLDKSAERKSVLVESPQAVRDAIGTAHPHAHTDR